MQAGPRQITLLRPLLRLRKQALEAYCQAHALPIVRDPTNADVRFQRNWVGRELLAQCDACGATLERCRGHGGPCLVDVQTVMDTCAAAATTLQQRALEALDHATEVDRQPPHEAHGHHSSGVDTQTLPLLPWWRAHPPLAPHVVRIRIDCPSFAAHPSPVQRVAMSVMLQVRRTRGLIRRIMPAQALAPAAPPPSTSVIKRMLRAMVGGRMTQPVQVSRFALRALPRTHRAQAMLTLAERLHA